MHGDGLTRTCRFKTTRLDVADYHTAPLPVGDTVADVIARLLTAATTRTLPSSWRGDYDSARAASWIAERDNESVVLLATDRASRLPVGLIILFEAPYGDNAGGVEVRLGYLLAESVWGRGLGSELVAGFIEWCRSIPRVRSVAAGVRLDNIASARVLARNGFVPRGPPVDGEQLYHLDL